MKIIIRLLVGSFLIVVCLFVYSFATTTPISALQSTHYIFTETSLGGNGTIATTSPNYQASESSGILGLGTSASPDFQVEAGNQTTNDPALAFEVNNTSVNLGTFSPTTTATSTSSFQVLDYTSSGYVVQTIGAAPSNGSHVIAAMGTTGPSQAGVEQFGINLVANTSPTSLGANPNLGQFGVGAAAANYNTPNNYRYVNGDTIASASKSSGVATYTISYIVNVSDITPGGQYTSNQSLICTGTY